MSTGVGAVVALKQLAVAKSRFQTVPIPLRQRLAWMMATDTIRALQGVVDQVLVISAQPAVRSMLARHGLEVEVAAEPRPGGLNPALALGSEILRGRGLELTVACVGDIPALRSDSAARVIAAARVLDRSFLSDASGIGTTMLLANGCDLAPHFQGRSSAAHHSSGAHRLDDQLLGGPLADARRDVDNEVDLYDASFLGLGRDTSTLIAPGAHALGRYQPLTIAEAADGAWQAITPMGTRIEIAAEVVDPSLRNLHLGQRLHACLGDDHRVLSAWL